MYAPNSLHLAILRPGTRCVCVGGGGQKSANSIRDPAVRAVCEVGISALSFFGANICSGLSVSLVFPL